MKKHAFKSAIFSAVTGVTLSLFLTSCGEKETPAPTVEKTQKVEKKSNLVLDTTEEPAPPVAREVKQVNKGPFKPAPVPEVNDAEPFVLEDMSQIKVNPGEDSPKIGDTIYTYTTIPEKACGEYWVQDASGVVMKLAVCTDDHEHGEGH